MVGGLETLNLGQNHLGNDGAHILKDGLMKNKSLLRLGLYSCRISDQGRESSTISLLFFQILVCYCSPLSMGMLSSLLGKHVLLFMIHVKGPNHLICVNSKP